MSATKVKNINMHLPALRTDVTYAAMAATLQPCVVKYAVKKPTC